MAARLARISIYPIKSCDGLTRPQATLLPSGALEYDRRWALLDEAGNFVTAKRTAKMHLLRARFDDALSTVSLSTAIKPAHQTFDLQADKQRLEAWLSDFFEMRVILRENARTGFPDDTNAPGPTVVSTATLETVAAWFPGMSLDECRRRFRANLEIDGVEAFWEDRLFAAPGEEVAFMIGPAALLGVNPCQRCVVPSRAPETGELWPSFQVEFSRRREATRPTWSESSRFNHFYRLATNTRVAPPAAMRSLQVGDAVRL